MGVGQVARTSWLKQRVPGSGETLLNSWPENSAGRWVRWDFRVGGLLPVQRP
jgi:hypothetical protein